MTIVKCDTIHDWQIPVIVNGKIVYLTIKGITFFDACTISESHHYRGKINGKNPKVKIMHRGGFVKFARYRQKKKHSESHWWFYPREGITRV